MPYISLQYHIASSTVSALDVGYCSVYVCVSVFVMVTLVSLAQTAGPIDLPFRGQARVDPNNCVLNDGTHGYHLANTIERPVLGGDARNRLRIDSPIFAQYIIVPNMQTRHTQTITLCTTAVAVQQSTARQGNHKCATHNEYFRSLSLSKIWYLGCQLLCLPCSIAA